MAILLAVQESFAFNEGDRVTGRASGSGYKTRNMRDPRLDSFPDAVREAILESAEVYCNVFQKGRHKRPDPIARDAFANVKDLCLLGNESVRISYNLSIFP